MTGPVGVVEDARLFQQFVSVSAEVVTLSLERSIQKQIPV